MYSITVDDKTIEITASAGTPVAYERIFGEDVLSQLMKMRELDNKNEQALIMDKLLPKLAFVMSSEAKLEPKELLKLTEEDYISWLLTMPPKAITSHTSEIMTVYNGNQSRTSTPKKE